MAELESAIERYLKKQVEAKGGLALKFGVVGIRGYQDRLCILPGNIIFFIECKRPKKGRLAELQKVRQAGLRSLGCRVYVVDNRGEVDEIIDRETA